MLKRAAVLLVLLIAGLALADSASDLYPLELGRWWAYNDSTPDGYFEFTSTVKSMEIRGDIPYYYIVDTYEEGEPDTTVIMVKEDGLYSELDMGDMGYEYPIEMLMMPEEVNVGDEWVSFVVDTVMDLGGGMMADVYVYTTGHAIGYEDVGDYSDCMRVQIHSTFMVSLPPFYEDSSDFVANEQWLKEGVGPVKMYEYNFDPMGESTSSVAYMTSYGTGEGIGEKGRVPEELSVSAYPNPFNGECRIETLPLSEITITDLRGSVVDCVHSDITGGAHWNPGGKPSGIYFASVRTSKQAVTEKLIYMK